MSKNVVFYIAYIVGVICMAITNLTPGYIGLPIVVAITSVSLWFIDRKKENTNGL